MIQTDYSGLTFILAKVAHKNLNADTTYTKEADYNFYEKRQDIIKQAFLQEKQQNLNKYNH